MAAAISRAQFLRGDISGKRRAMRPPWSLPEGLFTSSCSRCDECRKVCPEHIIKKGRGGFPEIDFSLGECLFCGDCVTHCGEGALTRDVNEGLAPWFMKARISERCLAHAGVVCITCGEQCESRAIQFMPLVGGVSIPDINEVACTGCGACFRPCPVRAIEMFVSALHYQDTGNGKSEYSDNIREEVVR